MPNNDTLKALLHNARLIYQVKAVHILSDLSGPNPTVNTVNDQMNTFFGHLSNPKLWSEPITFDRGKISQEILNISSVKSDQVDLYLQNTRSFLETMEDQVLKAALQRVATTPTQPMNLRTIDALNQTTRTLEGRLDHFANAGNDLRRDPTFSPLASRQASLLSTYTELLTNNAIESTQSKVNTVNQWKTMFGNMTDTTLFLRLYPKYNDFLAKQTEASDHPVVLSKGAFTNNQQALDALAVTMVKLDREVSKYADAGVDWAQDTRYQGLKDACPSILSAYRQALFNDTVEATTTVIEEIQKTGNQIAASTNKDDFLDQYSAFNDLMKNQTPATA